MNIQGWFPLGLTGLISLHSKGPSKVFSSTTDWKHQFFGAQPSLWSNSYICTWCQFVLLYGRNEQNVVKIKKKSFKKPTIWLDSRWLWNNPEHREYELILCLQLNQSQIKNPVSQSQWIFWSKCMNSFKRFLGVHDDLLILLYAVSFVSAFKIHLFLYLAL